MVTFKIKKSFFLSDGKIVFAGEFIKGEMIKGRYKVLVNGEQITDINIVGEMSFPSKTTTDRAVYSFDKIDKSTFDTQGEVLLQHA